MADIRCPKCGTVFSVDDTTYANIVKQIRDKEFEEELKTRNETSVRLVAAEKDGIITSLQSQVSNYRIEKELAVRSAVEEKQLEMHKKDMEIARLRDALSSQKEAAAQDKSAALQLVEAQKQKELTELKSALAAKDSEYSAMESRLLGES